MPVLFFLKRSIDPLTVGFFDDKDVISVNDDGISRNVWPEKIPFMFIHEHSSIPCTGHHVIHFLFYQIHSTSFDQSAVYLSELTQIDQNGFK